MSQRRQWYCCNGVLLLVQSEWVLPLHATPPPLLERLSQPARQPQERCTHRSEEEEDEERGDNGDGGARQRRLCQVGGQLAVEVYRLQALHAGTERSQSC